MEGHEQDGESAFDLLDYDGLVPDGLSPFVGRDDEIQNARTFLLEEKNRRLLTLVGIGGVGKSRLLEHLAGDLVDTDAVPDGITMVRLDNVPPSADVIASTIAHRVLGVDNASESALARLITHFKDKRAVLLLDNCEQLVVDDGPLPRLLNLLLRATASKKKQTLRVVATSQVQLGCVGERVMNIPPLGVEEALEVFTDRAAALDEPVAPADYPLARRLCEATDGIPLAVELAAGQLDRLTLQQLVKRAEADDLLPVLVDGTSEQRYHRTMAGSIARSHALLSGTEQRVFALLGVFRGFDVDAAVAVVSRFDVDPDEIEPVIVRLRRRSLLVAADYDGRKRYRMRPIIRQFAQQRLHDGAADIAELHQAHDDYFLEFSTRARREWFGPHEPFWMRAISIDLPNYRDVQERLLANPVTAAKGLELALNTTATRAFVFGGRLRESRRMLEAGLAKHPDEPSLGQVAALSLTLWVAVLQGEQELADALLEQVEKAAKQLDCWETYGPVLYARGTRIGLNAPDATQVRAAFDLLARAESALGSDGVFGEEFMAALFHAIVAALVGNKETAFALAMRVLAMAKAAQAQWCISWGLWVLALAELIHGDDPGAATRRGQEALSIMVAIGDRWGRTWAKWLLALCAIKRGDFELGAVLLGGADREQGISQTKVAGLLSLLRAQQMFAAMARHKLGDSTFEDLVAAGNAMEPEESLRLALPDEPVDLTLSRTLDELPRAAATPQSVLSKQQLEVAHLVSEGKTNAEIAAVLVLSERTVEGHIRLINNKLGTRNRTEITAYVMKNSLVRPV